MLTDLDDLRMMVLSVEEANADGESGWLRQESVAGALAVRQAGAAQDASGSAKLRKGREFPTILPQDRKQQ